MLNDNGGKKMITYKRLLNTKLRSIIVTLLIFSLLLSSQTISYASEGEIGFFGGISEGDYLPKTIEKYVPNDNKDTKYAYKEVVFLSGEPIEVSGTITVVIDDENILDEEFGMYNERYVIEATNVEKNVTLKRNLQLETSYYVKEGEFKKQVVKDSNVKSWAETVTTEDTSYTLDSESAIFSKATVEDITPGVTYYNTSLSYSGTFYDGDGNSLLMVVAGDIYGYIQPWSKVETQNINMGLSSEALGIDINMDIKLHPRLEAKKTIYYNENEPFPISFGGTYNQRMEREATLEYEILSYHPELTPSQLNNSILLTTANEIEKLPIPEGLDFIEGFWAEDDIKKLYSMEILTGTPHLGMHFEAMSRGDFVKALCLAMDIDTKQYENLKSDAPEVFGDVAFDHPLYPYIMGAFNTKLVKGTGENFDINLPITRQEAFVIYIRVIGLERLGVTGTPTTPFVDDAKISSWAKKEIAAGYRLGIIQGNASGEVMPKSWISKAESAAIINRLIDYLREEIGKDYK